MYRTLCAFANFIEDDFDLPNLFIGEYQGVSIDYIWGINALGYPHNTKIGCFVVGSNRWIRGFSFSRKGVSPLVDMTPYPDEIYQLLRRDLAFASWTMLHFQTSAILLEPGGVKGWGYGYSRKNAKSGITLEDAFVAAIELIDQLAQDKESVVAPPPTNYATPAKGRTRHWCRPLDFVTHYEQVSMFGLSGMFGMEHEPHDLEYVMEVTVFSKYYYTEEEIKASLKKRLLGHFKRWIRRPESSRLSSDIYVFVKSKRWFRGTHFVRHCLGGIPRDSTIVEFNDPVEDWGKLIESTDEPKPEPSNDEYKRISIRFSNAGGDIEISYQLPYFSPHHPEIWQAIAPLIQQIDQAR